MTKTSLPLSLDFGGVRPSQPGRGLPVRSMSLDMNVSPQQPSLQYPIRATSPYTLMQQQQQQQGMVGNHNMMANQAGMGNAGGCDFVVAACCPYALMLKIKMSVCLSYYKIRYCKLKVFLGIFLLESSHNNRDQIKTNISEQILLLNGMVSVQTHVRCKSVFTLTDFSHVQFQLGPITMTI